VYYAIYIMYYATFNTFELSSVTLKLLHSKLTILNVYRSPPATTKTRKSMPFSLFLSELNTFISHAATTTHEFLINYWRLQPSL